MIKCDDSGTHITGNVLDVVQDLVNVIVSVRKTLGDRMSQEDADKLIALSGQVAFAKCDEDKPKEQEGVESILKVLAEC